MEKSQLIGRWFSDDKGIETDDGETVETRTIQVSEYLKNGSLNSEGHCVIKTISDGDKTEIFLKIAMNGTWELIDNSLFHKIENVNAYVEEVFVNDLLVTTDEIRTELKQKLDSTFPIGSTVELMIVSCTNEKMIYEQVKDDGTTKVESMIKTNKSYAKYFS